MKLTIDIQDSDNFEKIKNENPDMSNEDLINYVLDSYFVMDFWSKIGVAYANSCEGVTIYKDCDYCEFRISGTEYDISKNSVESVEDALLVNVIDFIKPDEKISA